jgi:cell division protein FtsN
VRRVRRRGAAVGRITKKEKVMGSVRLIGALVLMLPVALAAQQAPRASDSVFAQAQRLVAEGRGEEGRALVERTLASAPAGSSEYAAALYWRGVMAPTAAEAERDLRRVIVEFSLSPNADDALLRLAQLEIARGDRVRATEHLERLLAEHPTSDVRPRAQLTIARMQLDAGQLAPACAQLRDAAANTPATEIELRNQIAFMQQRCTGVPNNPNVAETRSSNGEAVAQTPRRRTAPRQAPGPVDTAIAQTHTAAAPQSDSATATRPAPSIAQPAPAAATSATASSGGRFSVQVGAFSTRAQADKVRQALSGRGYSARVVPGPRDLFRVRVGHYADRDGAGTALATMKRSGVDGIVVEVEPR